MQHAAVLLRRAADVDAQLCRALLSRSLSRRETSVRDEPLDHTRGFTAHDQQLYTFAACCAPPSAREEAQYVVTLSFHSSKWCSAFSLFVRSPHLSRRTSEARSAASEGKGCGVEQRERAAAGCAGSSASCDSASGRTSRSSTTCWPSTCNSAACGSTACRRSAGNAARSCHPGCSS